MRAPWRRGKRKTLPGGPINWKTNLACALSSQLLCIMGSMFSMAFVAYFIQTDLGVTDVKQAQMWNWLFNIATPISLAVMSPVWGAAADRYGRKIMMLRANLGSAVLLAAMGLAHSVETLMVLRLAQGVLTGTVSAAQTLVASHTPERRQGVALGAMTSAVFAGSALGSWRGGVFSHAFGYRNAFFASGAILFVSALLVLLGVRENFQRPAVAPGKAGAPGRRPGPRAWAPILALMAAVGVARQFDAPTLPFLAQLAHGGVEGAELWMSRVLMAFAAGALAGSSLLGWLADRVAPPTVAKLCALCAGLCVIPQMLATSLGPLLWGRLGLAFFAGGLDPVLQMWLSRVTPRAQRGQAFGWAVTAQATGWTLGPSLSTWLSIHYDVRTSYFAMSELYILLIPLITRVSAWVVHPATRGVVDKEAEQGEA